MTKLRVNLVAAAGKPHHEVVWLDVSVQEVLCVHVLHATNLKSNDCQLRSGCREYGIKANHLIGKQKHCLHCKLSRAEIQEIFQTRPKQLHHHHIVITLDSEPLEGRNADYRYGGD